MSGNKKAPIATEAANALASQGRKDYSWTTTNFADVFDDINLGITQKEIDDAAGPKPDKEAFRAEVEASIPIVPDAGGNVAHNRGIGIAGSAVQRKAAIEKALNERYNKELETWETKRAETGQGLLKAKEQANFGTEVARAEGSALSNIEGAGRAATRNASRMGLRSASPEVQAEMDRVRAFNRAEAKATAGNTTRTGLRDMSVARAQMATGLGAAIKQMGMGTLGTAADMEAGRNKYNASQVGGSPLNSLIGGASTALMVIGSGGTAIPALVAGGLSAAAQ